MSRVLLRASSVLFMLTGIISGVINWLTYQTSMYFSTTRVTTTAGLTIAYVIAAVLGFITLTRQAQAERHWLGWLGVVLTLLGLFMGGFVYTSMFISGASFGSDPGSIQTLLAQSTTPVLAMGLVFWAMDLPNTTRQLLFQKAMMGALAFLPYLFSLALQQLIAHQINYARSFLFLGSVDALLWICLGASVWAYPVLAAAASPAPEPAQQPDSSFEYTVSHMPPSER